MSFGPRATRLFWIHIRWYRIEPFQEFIWYGKESNWYISIYICLLMQLKEEAEMKHPTKIAD